MLDAKVASEADVSQNGNRSAEVIEAAKEYIDKGYAVVPMPGGSKAPNITGWQKKKFSARDFTPGDNIGIKPVDGLVDVDLDVPEAVELARSILPDTDKISGHKGNPNSHYWYCADGTQTKRYEDIDGTMLIERRASGVQTVVAPSIHPEGHQYQWYRNGSEKAVDADVLTEKTDQLAATTIIARHWPQEQGGRHEFALGIAGFLTKGLLDGDTVVAIVGDAARVGGDDEVEDRIQAAQTTVDRDPDSIKGQSVLVDMLGEKDAYAITKKLTDWLHLKRQPREKKEAPKQEPVLKFTRFDQIPETVLNWFWRGYIPLGKLVILDAMPDQGKSMLSIHLIACTTTDGMMPDGSRAPIGGAVMIFYEDDASDTVKPRLRASGANMQRVIDLSKVQYKNPETGEIIEKMFVLPDDNDMLEAAINEIGAKLVVIDPLFAALNSKINSKNDQETRQALTPLANIAARTGCTILLIRHFNKGESDDLLMRGAGNLGIVGAARGSLAVLPDPDDENKHVLVAGKHNLTKERPPQRAFHIDSVRENEPFVVWDGIDNHSLTELMGSTKLSSEHQEVIRLLETNGPMALQQFYDHFKDKNPVTVRSWLTRLVDRELIASPARNVYAPLGKNNATTATTATIATNHQQPLSTTIDSERERERENVAVVAHVAYVADVASVANNRDCCDPPDDPDCDCD